MNKKFRSLLLTLTLIILLFGFAFKAAAVLGEPEMYVQSPDTVANQVGASAGYNTEVSPETGLASFLGFIVQILLSFLGVLFSIYVIYGGFTWLMSAGSEEKIDKAKKIIRDGLIGLVITLSAVGIYLLVTELFGSGGSYQTEGTFNVDLIPVHEGDSWFKSNW